MQAQLTDFDAPAQTMTGDADIAVPESPDELLNAAAEYAQTIDVDVDIDDIDWEVSHRAKRRAGACKFNRKTGDITISLTWKAYEELGWEEMKGTIRHELIHAEDYAQRGDSGHGLRFKMRAEDLNAPRHCPKFAEGDYVLECAECGEYSGDRHRASKTVKQPQKYTTNSCDCDGNLRVTHVETGQTWTDNEGYRAAKRHL